MDGQPFQKGDFVCRMGSDELSDAQMGHVTGFCPGPQWLRVKTFNNQYRIWSKEKTNNVDYVCGEGAYDIGLSIPPFLNKGGVS